jgi:hypothetical protein
VLAGSPRIDVPNNLQGVDRLLGELEALTVGLTDGELDEV